MARSKAVKADTAPTISDSQALLSPEDELRGALALNAQRSPAPAPKAPTMPVWAWGIVALGAYKLLSKPARR